ncbi:CRP-like cAMP-binding protein [Marinilabilia salmonicolor]|jgi:CRP-like cAMP-binding protein|uniref:Crp/Fnr family transcriptional regulator n=1 Tax=Marinilabilia salmonicolor TaxID=989 RepID=UPI000D07E242|nr:Crp/Fnr family transcriptional regulator [Marinilabilia salmonicolor]PRZ01256.1 CRP-like cAMP-binding protein [Marinilabilia salmonicolor]
MKRSQEQVNVEEIDLKSFDIFNGLTDAEIESLSQSLVCTSHKRGSVIYDEGSRINGSYIVAGGVLKIYKTGFDGKEQIIRFAKGGDLIGFRSIVSDELACTTARVIQDAILCYVPGDIITSFIKGNPEFAMALMRLTCRELGESNKFLTDIAQKTVRERLAEVLLLLMDTFDLDEENTLKISLTREELANMVGTATESVIRLLSEFKADHLIELNGRKIKLLNIPKLIKIGNVYV